MIEEIFIIVQLAVPFGAFLCGLTVGILLYIWAWKKGLQKKIDKI